MFVCLVTQRLIIIIKLASAAASRLKEQITCIAIFGLTDQSILSKTRTGKHFVQHLATKQIQKLHQKHSSPDM